MADITENTQNPVWSNGIYQIETSDRSIKLTPFSTPN